MRNLSCFFMLGLVISWPAVGAQMTVGDLQKFCASSSELEQTACSYYIWGATEGASLGAGSVKDNSGTFRELKDKPFCVPEGLAKADLQQIVRKRIGEDLAAFPQDRELPAVSFVVAVVAHRFPCGKSK